MNTPPEGFEPLFRTGPYLDLIGPLYNKRTDSELIIGFYVEEKHCNARGFAHGGVICGVADVALGYSCAFSTNPPTPIVTSNLSVDFSDSVQIGDWVEVKTEIQKLGRTNAFANCYFYVGEKRVARASAVFSVMNKQ